MSTVAWILVTVYAFVWLIFTGTALTLHRRARDTNKPSPRPAWIMPFLTLAWPINVALEIGKRFAKSIELNE